MRLVFAGTPDAAIPSLRALIASPHHDVVGVITRPDAPAGRGRTLQPSPVRVLAQEHGIPVLTPARVDEPDFVAELTELDPQCCPVVAYGALLREPVLSLPLHGWVNLHFSLLPAWRGAAPVQWSLLSGDDVTGASTFRIEAGLDTGPVFGTLVETIRPDDTAGTLLDRLAQSGAQLLLATMDAIADGSAVAVPQPFDDVTFAPRIETDDARVRWADPALAIDRRIRAMTPAPGAWTTVGTDADSRVKLGPVTLLSDEGATDLAPGQVRVTKHAVDVGTGSTPVRLGTVQPVGGKAMPAADWARGLRMPLERLH